MYEQAMFEKTMRRAIELSQLSPLYNENPRVGAVLINDAGEIVAEGWHKGIGTPHAEVDALSKVSSANGLTAVVTLEPCNHTGTTGPCAQALIAAGIKRVVFAAFDPGTTEGGGRFTLEQAGIEVVGPILSDEYIPILKPWIVNKFNQRPYVVIKYAASIDGRVAAEDNTSKWITGSVAREDVHARRAASQAIIAGTNTVALDDPELTARKSDGSLYETQPLRVVVGERDLSPISRVFNADAETVQLKTRDLGSALATLYSRGIRQVFVEGGAQIQSELIRLGYADEYLIYLAPKLIGGSQTAVRDIDVKTIGDAIKLRFIETKTLGEDILIRAIHEEN
ncbi:MAG: bifunctional diaminohydroxyphosphoribosylaminopyrimidine deaminase/5-amino-6-(5-phosphoribosylamino)uracil reductase RibD [Micrococcales bacterium]